MAAAEKKSVLISRAEVQRRIGHSRSSIYSKLRRDSDGYDPTFPRPIALPGVRTIRWLEHEIDEWLDGVITASRANDQEDQHDKQKP